MDLMDLKSSSICPGHDFKYHKLFSDLIYDLYYDLIT